MATGKSGVIVAMLFYQFFSVGFIKQVVALEGIGEHYHVPHVAFEASVVGFGRHELYIHTL